MNPTLPPGLASPVPLSFNQPTENNEDEIHVLVRRVCYVLCFERKRGVLSMTIAEFVDRILKAIRDKPDDKVPDAKRIRNEFEELLRIILYYTELVSAGDHKNAALLRRALEDSAFELPGEATVKRRRPNGNGLSAHP